ncbi:hypothetical protein FRC03_000831 [Tulasnella sp. 419]|nr:hypothetical protein FRC03_000831 [Tulasnella sp. 419]
MLAASRRSASITIRSVYTPFIGGKFIIGNGETFDVENPATGESLCTITSASPSDISSAISQADSAFQSGVWSKSSVIHRSKTLSRLARILEERLPDLAVIESQQTGRPIREMKTQLGRLPEWLDYFAALIRTQQGFVAPTQGNLLNYVTRVPLGAVAQITPFNHPLLIGNKKIAPALAAGNSVIVKPSELAPISVLEFAEMATEAGIPPHVLSVLPGGASTGKEIVSSPLIRKIDVTAGTPTGRAIGSIAGQNLASYVAELGGKAPIVVFDDADVESAVNGVAFSAFVASGQTCVSGTRLIVQDGIYDSFMKRFIEKVQSITKRIGDPLNPLSTMGPVVSRSALERVIRMVSNSPRKVAFGGERLTGASPLDGYDYSKGYFYPPTIIENVETEDELWQEEVFGPVLVVKRFKEESVGLRLANECKYGLGAGIWTSDLSRAHRVSAGIEAGLCWVNTHHRNDPSSPW